MRVNLTELVEGQKKELDLEVEAKIENIGYFGDEIPLVAPVVFKGKIYNANGEIYIEGIVESTGEFSCYRCLEKFQKKIIGEIHEKLIYESSPQAEIEEYFIIKNNMINISEIMENVLISALPMKIVCDEQCRGLCLVCGENLNKHQCNCEKDEIDPRLAKLKDLLQ
ncbi:DUF177 domain-containing protein [Crassaminicella thermophila]|uniref:DUF177 domain-containing protein n=1 Tax=Crassaminicella thermophila TaxID=2599308 RepID=A0A5C0SBM5_CRATE|nr:DUF177 domain-containing protein [Crassaminicella thermophila]QEK12015.1 DUF177 domain-containing protein [Crassaminicella thermophila]